MRLAEIAKELRITTQHLRKELGKTNFGINASAHDIDDNLAKGVIRFLKGKVKPTLTHRRVAVVFKDEKEVEKKTKASRKKAEKKEGDEKSEDEKVGMEVEEKSRAAIPKETPVAKAGGNEVIVTRRIEIDLGKKKAAPGERPSPAVKKDAAPKTYYKSKGKRRGRGRYIQQADEEVKTIARHPKAKVSRVHYDAEGDEGLTAEELLIERQLDQERFRAQKKTRSGFSHSSKAQPQIKAKTGVIEIPKVVSVKEFSEKCGLSVTDVIANLFKNGIMATINQKIDFDTAAIVAADLNMEVKMAEQVATSEDLFAGDLKSLLAEDDKKVLKKRPPIVTVMGHVDHGKTRLLDTIRNTNVVAGESGGITQHIGAYQVEKNGHLITFLDTPGHEAFTSMRARGAKVTDIAILVVAADEGVKTQTIEALNHAKEAGVTIIVAINKIDKPNANVDKVKGELVEYGLQSEDWGGKTIMVPMSAHTGEGVENLLEMILLVAEMEGYKANPKRMAVGTVIEAHLDPSLGPVATILINAGTLKVTNSVVVGSTSGRVKTMRDDAGKNLKAILPSGAVRISGLDKTPKAGDILQAFKNEKIAKERLRQVIELNIKREVSESGSMVERIVSQIGAGNMKYLKLVVKADTKGSLEAILQELEKIKSEDVAVKVIHYGVGNISDTDIVMASASNALIAGFHVSANTHVRKLAAKERVDIKDYTIIYKLTEDVKAFLSGMLEPEIKVIELGKLEIKQIFLSKKAWVIAGCKVTSGKVEKDSLLRVMRDDKLLFESRIDSLKVVQEDVTELEKGSECGLRFKTPKPVQEGDTLEVFKIEKKERKLE